VGIHTFSFNDDAATHLAPDGAALPGRKLTTEVRYPTEAGSPATEVKDAPPAKAGAPYPVIVFAHGFDTEPSQYAQLLDSWVRAGFVVVAPIFPDESSQAVEEAGGPGQLELDVYSEPGDIVYVLQQLGSLSGQPWGSHLNGVLNLSDLALAGQSDGANVVAALSYASSFRRLYDDLPSAPKATAVMSGQMWDNLYPKGHAGTYRGGSDSPAMLQVQSDADGCVLPYPSSSTGKRLGPLALWSTLQPGLSSKWFLTLFGAEHLPPYFGTQPWAAVVQSVTTEFFELELRWRSSSVSDASLRRSGTSGGVAAIGSGRTVTMPVVTPLAGCFSSARSLS
jgi:hypothetical protein